MINKVILVSLVAISLFPLHVHAGDQDTRENIIKDLFELSRVDGREVVREHPNLDLALLFLDAKQEQFEALDVRMLRGVTMEPQFLRFNRADHFFNELDPAPFSIASIIKSHYWLSPDGDKKLEFEKRKVETQEELASLKKRLLTAILEDMQKGSPDGSRITIDEIKSEIINVIREFPGNSQDKRVAYLKALFSSGSYNLAIREQEEELRFNIRLAKHLLENDSVFTYEKSLFVFNMLLKSFDTDLSSPYFLWSKIIPRLTVRRQYPSLDVESIHVTSGGEVSIDDDASFNNRADLRFYVSTNSVFMKDVFENALPLALISAWRGVAKEGKNGKQEIANAINIIESFISKNRTKLSPFAVARIEKVKKIITELSITDGLVTGGFTANTTEAREFSGSKDFITGNLTVKLGNGTTLNAKIAPYSVVGLQNPDQGIIYASYEAGGFRSSAKLNPLKKTIIRKFKEPGLFMPEVTLTSEYMSKLYGGGSEPGNETSSLRGSRDDSTQAIGVKIEGEFASISYIPVTLSNGNYFKSILCKMLFEDQSKVCKL